MIKKKNIYITFPKGEALNGWINNFLIQLKTTLSRITEDTPGWLIKEIDFNSENYHEYIPQSYLYIVFLGTNTDDEVEYIQEVTDVYESLDIEKTKITDPSRLFKIYLQPETIIDTIGAIESVLPYIFFNQNKRIRPKHKQMDFHEDHKDFWAKLLDLAYDLKEALLIDDHLQKNENEKIVYLGMCSDDQNINRDEIKRELKHIGMRVLPVTNLPVNNLFTMEDVISMNLICCHHIIQIFGAGYGTVASGEKISDLEMENKVIQDHLNDNESISRIVWIPTQKRNIEQKQQLFISRIKREDSYLNTEVVESGTEDFKNILTDRLIYKSKKNEQDDIRQGIYLISHPSSFSENIESVAKNEGIKIIKTDKSGNTYNYRNHLENLKKAECVLIHNPETDINWLTSNLKDLVKAQGLGKDKPFLSIGVYAEKIPQIDDVTRWLPNIFHVIPGNEESIIEFLNIAKV